MPHRRSKTFLPLIDTVTDRGDYLGSDMPNRVELHERSYVRYPKKHGSPFAQMVTTVPHGRLA